MRNINSLPGKAAGTSVARNDPCPCGSGRKYKHCCAVTRPAARHLQDGLPPGKSPPFLPPGLPARADPKRQTKAAEELHQRGIRLIEAGRHAEAVVALRNAVQLDPGRAVSHHHSETR